MKIFLDTAETAEIREIASWGILDGVTTNPSLIAKSGRKFIEVIEEIAAIVDGPISAETIASDFTGMIGEARELSKIHKNIVVKLPMTVEGLKTLKVCVEEGIKTNVTLVFSANQALLVGKIGASYVSPFVGRLDDISQVGMDLIEQIKTIYANYTIDTQILVASIRNPIHFLEAAIIGADVATVPYSVIRQLTQHPLTDLGIERFLKDWEKVPKI